MSRSPTKSTVVRLPQRALSLQEAFDDFLMDRRNQRVSDKTIETYTERFAMLAKWCEEQGITSITEVDAQVMKAYFNHLRTRPKDWTITKKDGRQSKIPNDKKLSRQTVKSHFLSLHALFEYLTTWERIPRDPMSKFSGREFSVPKTKMNEKYCPTVEEMRRVMDLFAPGAKPYHGVGEDEWPFLRERNLTLLLLKSATAIRSKEVLEITMDDMDLENKVMRVLRKGQKQDDDPRIIHFTPTVRQQVSRYVEARAAWLRMLGASSDHLFITGDGKPMSKTSLRRLFVTIRKLTGVPVTPHLTRHHAITEAWKVEGATPRDVQTFADHTQLSTTMGYSHMTQKEARQFVERGDFARKLLRR